jgi:hypothetical protein
MADKAHDSIAIRDIDAGYATARTFSYRHAL